MKKNTIIIIAFAVVLALLIGSYFLFTALFEKEEEGIEGLIGEIPYIWDENPFEVEYVEYKLESGSFVIRATGAGLSGITYTLENYESDFISQTELQEAVGAVAILAANKKLDVKKGELSKYGFDKSKNTIVLHMPKNKKHTLVIGNAVGVSNEVYVLDKEKSKVYTMTQNNVNVLLKEASEYRDEVICNLNNFFIRELTVHKGNEQKIGIVSDGIMGDGLYYMTYPYKDCLVSQESIDKLLSLFEQVVADEIVEENPTDIAKYGLDNPLIIYIYDSGEKHTLEFGNMAPEGGLYIMYEDKPLVYRGNCAIYEELKDVDPVMYLEEYVHFYTADTVSKIKATKGSESVTLELIENGDKLTLKINSKEKSVEDFSEAFGNIVYAQYSDLPQFDKKDKVYCTVSFTFKDGTVKDYVYYDYSDEYCYVKSSAGFDCLVAKSVVNSFTKVK